MSVQFVWEGHSSDDGLIQAHKQFINVAASLLDCNGRGKAREKEDNTFLLLAFVASVASSSALNAQDKAAMSG